MTTFKAMNRAERVRGAFTEMRKAKPGTDQLFAGGISRWAPRAPPFSGGALLGSPLFTVGSSPSPLQRLGS